MLLNISLFYCFLAFIQFSVSTNNNKNKRKARTPVKTVSVKKSINQNNHQDLVKGLVIKYCNFKIKIRTYFCIDDKPEPDRYKTRSKTKTNKYYVCFYSKGDELIPTESDDIYETSSKNLINILDTKYHLIMDSAILIYILKEKIFAEFIQNHVELAEFKINQIITYFAKISTLSNDKQFEECYEYLFSLYTCNLFSLYQAIIKRRNFLQAVFPEIIIMEKYLDSITIELKKEIKNITDKEEKLAFTKIVAAFALFEYEIKNIYQKFKKDRKYILSNDEEHKKSSFDDEKRIFVSNSHKIMHFIFTVARIYKGSDETITLHYNNLFLRKKNLAPALYYYFVTIIFSKDTVLTSFRIFDEIKDKEKYYPVKKLQFFNDFLNFVETIFLNKMDFNNDIQMWEEIMKMMDNFYTFVNLSAKIYLSIEEMDTFYCAYKKISDFYLFNFVSTGKYVICKTEYVKIFDIYKSFKRNAYQSITE